MKIKEITSILTTVTTIASVCKKAAEDAAAAEKAKAAALADHRVAMVSTLTDTVQGVSKAFLGHFLREAKAKKKDMAKKKAMAEAMASAMAWRAKAK